MVLDNSTSLSWKRRLFIQQIQFYFSGSYCRISARVKPRVLAPDSIVKLQVRYYITTFQTWHELPFSLGQWRFAYMRDDVKLYFCMSKSRNSHFLVLQSRYFNEDTYRFHNRGVSCTLSLSCQSRKYLISLTTN